MTEMPTPQAEAEEIEKDARSEKRLVWQAVAAIAVVAVVVIVREMFLR
jgi:uncharacterized membrane protein